MNTGLRIITRVAVFAALVFILSYFSSFLYNINPSFFIVFAAGFVWGVWPGIGIGVIGFFLWSTFNPFGPAPFPVLISQMIGISFSALIGGLAVKMIKVDKFNYKIIMTLALCGMLCGLSYHLVVDVVDAYLFQPFWPRLIGGLLFSLITVVSNSIIFPLLYPALVTLYNKDRLVGQ